ncbi:thioredoxin TrxA [Ilyobacter polytropus]|uniref:Thioredoxin n=1 Tax=Ilyobacter polytropus (strain ATCC 51220 / DSM 2926 / LMG 16218 / CuHBu1) TaxID=572544 RepID=E3HDN9_ILYPC|nr:thioredoxin family protein [Ilyobacter polytropus]ADO84225.1 Thioredoxin domain protein [Ilyobacter polytropus DSM 2926]
MIQLEKDTFEEKVLENKGLVLVDFWSDKCEDCKALLPHVEELSEEFGDKIKFTKFNTIGAMKVAIKQKVLGLPTVAIYKDGEKIYELVKENATKENIKKMINEVL